MADMARIGEYNGCGQKRVVKRMWPEEGNIIVVAKRGDFNGCGKRRVIQVDVARRGEFE